MFVVALPVGAGLLAWRNIRLGRGDRRGLFRLALFAFAGMFLRDGLTTGAVFWVLYLPQRLLL